MRSELLSSMLICDSVGASGCPASSRLGETRSQRVATKDRRQMFQAFTSPLPSVLEVFTRYRILSTQKRTPNAAVVDVDDLNFTGINRDLPDQENTAIFRIQKIRVQGKPYRTWPVPRALHSTFILIFINPAF